MRRALLLSCLGWIGASVPASAQDKPPAALEERAALSNYWHAFAQKHLVSNQTAPVSELRAQLRRAEELEQQGQHEEAALLLLELTLHPRFADYAELEEMDAANYALGSSLHALGAEESARAALRNVLRKGPDDPYFAPAFRRFVDVALAGAPLMAAISELSAYEPKLAEDGQNELNYVRGRERYDVGDRDGAKQR
ncbi:MAG TPA: hypothetical protein VGL13_01820, partial [Polyangiaceae bacterium]